MSIQKVPGYGVLTGHKVPGTHAGRQSRQTFHLASHKATLCICFLNKGRGLRENKENLKVVLLHFSDPHNLKICCRVNGEVVQSSNTNQMVFKTEELIAWVSQ